MPILTNLGKAFYLSPFYTVQCTCALATLGSEIYQEKSWTPKCYLMSLLFLSSTPFISINYHKYKRLHTFIKTNGYSKTVANVYLKTFCGRQQLKLACKELGFLNQFQAQMKKENIKFYQIDPQLWSAINSSSNFLIYICLLVDSLWHLKKTLSKSNNG